MSVVWGSSSFASASSASVDVDLVAVLIDADGRAVEAVLGQSGWQTSKDGSVVHTTGDSSSSSGATVHEELTIDFDVLRLSNLRAATRAARVRGIVLVLVGNSVPLKRVEGLTVTCELQPPSASSSSAGGRGAPSSGVGFAGDYLASWNAMTTGRVSELQSVVALSLLECPKDDSDLGWNDWDVIELGQGIDGGVFVDAVAVAVSQAPVSFCDALKCPAARGAVSFPNVAVKLTQPGQSTLLPLTSVPSAPRCDGGTRSSSSATTSLASEHVTVVAEVQWRVVSGSVPVDLDLSCIALSEPRPRRAILQRAFWGQTAIFDGAIVLEDDDLGGEKPSGGEYGSGSERVLVELRRLPTTVDTLVFVVQDSNGQPISNLAHVTFQLSTATPSAAPRRLLVASENAPHLSPGASGYIPAVLQRRGRSWEATAAMEECRGTCALSGETDSAVLAALAHLQQVRDEQQALPRAPQADRLHRDVMFGSPQEQTGARCAPAASAESPPTAPTSPRAPLTARSGETAPPSGKPVVAPTPAAAAGVSTTTMLLACLLALLLGLWLSSSDGSAGGASTPTRRPPGRR